MAGSDPSFVESTVKSRDGTPISLCSIGEGPGLVIVHGAFRACKHYRGLAKALCGQFTVILMDRRGRGKSGPQGEGYCMAKECEDVAAVLQQTGARFLFGHSYGGLVGLEAALRCPLIRLAVYEPAISVRRSIPHAWIPAFRQALKRRDYAEALALFTRGLALVRPINRMPKWLFKLLARWTVARSEWNETVSLLHTLEPEIREVAKLDSTVGKYGHVSINTLILAGERSPGYMHEGAEALAAAVPRSRLATLPKLDHMAPILPRPRLLAQQLKQFFHFTNI